MKKILLIPFLALFTGAYAQSDLEKRFAVPKTQQALAPAEERVYTVRNVDSPPAYTGGIEAFYKELKRKLWLPNGIKQEQGIFPVVISFTVEKDGSLSDAKLRDMVHSEGSALALQNEFVKALIKMDKWNPGKIDQKPVRVRVDVPFTIKIDELETERNLLRPDR